MFKTDIPYSNTTVVTNTTSTENEPEMHFRTSESILKIVPALIKASAKIQHAEKNAENGHFNNSYATIEAIIDASKEALLEQEVVVLQFPCKKKLTTRLQHISGEYFECDLELILTKQDMQGLGSAITYARRQSLTAMLNMAQADDDANDASRKSKVMTPKTVIKNVKKEQSESDF